MTTTTTDVTFHTPTGLGWHIEKAGRHFIVSAENPWWGNGYRSAVDVFRCDENGSVSNLKTVVTVENTTNHWDGIEALAEFRPRHNNKRRPAMTNTTTRPTSLDRYIDSGFDPAVMVEIIDRRLAVTTTPRTRNILLDMRIRAMFALDMRAGGAR